MDKITLTFSLTINLTEAERVKLFQTAQQIIESFQIWREEAKRIIANDPWLSQFIEVYGNVYEEK